jgi:hypothetical protein
MSRCLMPIWPILLTETEERVPVQVRRILGRHLPSPATRIPLSFQGLMAEMQR